MQVLYLIAGISFEEFLGMYKRLFLLCRTVVSGEASDILPQKSSQKVSFSNIVKPFVDIFMYIFGFFFVSNPLSQSLGQVKLDLDK